MFGRIIHPGEILKSEYIDKLDITTASLARDTGISRSHLIGIINEHLRISPMIAAKLARYFGTSIEFWLFLQAFHDAKLYEITLQAELQEIEPHPSVATAGDDYEI